MKKEKHELQSENTDKDPIDVRLAKLEGALASSWFFHTKEQYEKSLKETFRQEALATIIRWIVGVTIFLSGAGYLFIRNVVVDVYDTKNQLVIEDLDKKYDYILKKEQKRFEWQRHHNFANNYIHLAEFIKSSLMDSVSKTNELKKAFRRADHYFNYALHYDPSQGSTYWELGELYFTYPDKFGVPYLKNQAKALEYYESAEKSYKDFEISQGWRADAQRMIGIIYFQKLVKEDNSEKRKSFYKMAENSFIKSKEDYLNSIPESSQDSKTGLDTVMHRLARLKEIRH